MNLFRTLKKYYVITKNHTYVWKTLPFLLLIMFILGYCESLRWVFPVPKATHGFLKGISLLVGAELLLNRKKVRVSSNASIYIIILFWLFSYSLSAVFSQSPSTSLLYMWYPWICTVIFIALSSLRIKQKHIHIFIWSAAILLTATFVVATSSVIFHQSLTTVLPMFFLEQRVDQILKEVFMFGKCVGLGPYFMLVPIVVSFYFEKTTQKNKMLFGIVAIVFGLILAFMSNNRIDVFVLCVEMAIIFFCFEKKRRTLIVITTVCICLVGIGLSQYFTGINVIQRIISPTSEDRDMVNDRFYYWKLAAANFNSSPIVGIGPNAYNDVANFDYQRLYQRGVGNFLWRRYEPIGAHNIFFERLSDEGIVGTAAFLLLLGYFFYDDILFLRRKTEEKKRYILFSLASWSWILYGMTDNGYGVQGMVTFFVIRGMMKHL